MNRLWYLINDRLVAGEPVVVASLFNKSGSVPRADGAKMVIHANGSIAGTIGGGKLEAAVRELALQVFRSKASLIYQFDLTAFEIAETNMICGGTGKVLLDYVDATNPINLEIYSNIATALNKRERAWLLTALGTNLPDGKINRCLIKNDGTKIGQLECDYEELHQLVSKTNKVSIHSDVLDNQRLLIEPIRDTGLLYIFGAGHVAQQLAILAEMAGFKTIVIDDRIEYACKERFPKSDIILLESFNGILSNLQVNRDSYLDVFICPGGASYLYSRNRCLFSFTG